MSRFLVVLLCLPPALAEASSHSVQVLWEASSGATPDELQLPFALIDSADPEDPILSGGVLTLSTSDNSEIMMFRQQGAEVMIPDHLVIEARLRYVSGSTSTSARLPVNIALTTEPTVGNALWIGQDQIFLLVSNSIPGVSAFVDTDDAFHDYRIEVVGAAITVYHDDVQVLTGSTYPDVGTNGDLPRVSFGNGSILSQGVSEWQSFEHNAGPPVVDANWINAFGIQADGGAVHPSLLVGLQPLLAPPSATIPDPETILLSYSGLDLNEEIQIDLASYGLPFYPPDPIRVIGADRLEVDVADNGTMFTLVIQLASSTGELLDPASILGFNPQPEPPAASDYAFNPPPTGPSGALSILAPLTGGSPAPGHPTRASGGSGGTEISLSLQVLDGGGTPLPLSLVSAVTGVPEDHVGVAHSPLGLFYPSPYAAGAGTGVMPFHMPAPGRARIEVFDVAGRLVRVVRDAHAPEGAQRAMWDGRDASGQLAPSGLYTYRLTVPGGSYSRKLVVIRR